MRQFRRRLFWQVYPTVLISVALVAILGAMVWHLAGVAPIGSVLRMPGPFMHRFQIHSLGMLILVAILVGIGAFPLISRITRRLEALRDSVEAWGGGDLTRRAVVDGGDEIAAVAASFNAAADRTDALLSAHKTLLAHASHELRSPLARLALAVEMLADASGGALVPVIRGEIAELDTLVEEILLASRLDHGADIGRCETVDCLALAAEEAARAGVQMRDVPAGSPPFEVAGSPTLLRRLIRNLIENAIKHGAAPVEIALRHDMLDGEIAIVIEVRDNGPGIAPELRDRVFEPFFRPAGSSETTGSWGLGLSLVRQIAERHRGRVICSSPGRGGAIFSVKLPVGAR
ncbi:MAG: HAMP domain-containing sensor histidine kinase [Sphingomonas bacterium]